MFWRVLRDSCGASEGAWLYDDSSIIIHTTQKPLLLKLTSSPLHSTASDEGIRLDASVSVRLVKAVDIGFHIMTEKQTVDTMYKTFEMNRLYIRQPTLLFVSRYIVLSVIYN